MHNWRTNGEQKAGVGTQHVQAHDRALGVDERAARRAAWQRRRMFDSLEQVPGPASQGQRVCRHTTLGDAQTAARIPQGEDDVSELRAAICPGNRLDIAGRSRDQRKSDDTVGPFNPARDHLPRDLQLHAGSGKGVGHCDDSIRADDEARAAPGPPAKGGDGWTYRRSYASDLQHASIIHMEGMLPAMDDYEPVAAISEAASIIGDRWSPAVIAALLEGPLRYGELMERLQGIAPNILSARLKKLEADGLVVSSIYSERPARFEYRLTESGAELSDLLRLLGAWGARRTGSHSA